jgi:hypothetical protein
VTCWFCSARTRQSHQLESTPPTPAAPPGRHRSKASVRIILAGPAFLVPPDAGDGEDGVGPCAGLFSSILAKITTPKEGPTKAKVCSRGDDFLRSRASLQEANRGWPASEAEARVQVSNDLEH